MENYNSQAFTPEEVEKGLLQDLLNYLLDYNKKCESGYYDIHICSDGYCTIVEWVDINFNFRGEEGEFKYVPADGYILREFHFPDNHYEMFETEEEYNEALKDWLKDNPGWEKSEFGTWTNVIENEKFRKYLAGEVDEEIPEPPTQDKETTEEAYNKLDKEQKKKVQELLKND